MEELSLNPQTLPADSLADSLNRAAKRLHNAFAGTAGQIGALQRHIRTKLTNPALRDTDTSHHIDLAERLETAAACLVSIASNREILEFERRLGPGAGLPPQVFEDLRATSAADAAKLVLSARAAREASPRAQATSVESNRSLMALPQLGAQLTALCRHIQCEDAFVQRLAHCETALQIARGEPTLVVHRAIAAQLRALAREIGGMAERMGAHRRTLLNTAEMIEENSGEVAAIAGGEQDPARTLHDILSHMPSAALLRDLQGHLSRARSLSAELRADGARIFDALQSQLFACAHIAQQAPQEDADGPADTEADAAFLGNINALAKTLELSEACLAAEQRTLRELAEQSADQAFAEADADDRSYNWLFDLYTMDAERTVHQELASALARQSSG